MKRPFKFYLPDGSVETITDTTYLKTLGMTDEFIQKRQQQQEAHLTSEMYNERHWRNAELLLTDKMLLPDATYHSQQIQGSTMLDEIMNYRRALREYDLKYQPRPERPQWFEG